MNKSLEVSFIGMYDELEEIRASLPAPHNKNEILAHFRKGKFTGKGRLVVYPCRSLIPTLQKILAELEIPF